MAETLGMLCDKLTIVNLKAYHTDDNSKLESLAKQRFQLVEEIDLYINNAFLGKIPIEKLTFASNKVFKKEGNDTSEFVGNIGELFYNLANINCQLWHEVEKGYDIKNIPSSEKDTLINNLAVLNLNRNKCMDAIDNAIVDLISSQNN